MISCMTIWIGLGIPAMTATRSPSSEIVRTAVEKAIARLVVGAAGHVEKKSCFACHNQTYPVLALTTATARGFTVPKHVIGEQAEHVAEFLGDHIEEFRTGKGTGGQVDTAGAALLTLELAGYKPDETTESVVSYLLATQPNQGHWRSTSNRPPTEVSHFTATYLAIRGVKKWHTPDQAKKATTRIEAARSWLIKAKPVDHEDRAFRLLGVKESGADRREVAAAAFDVFATQRPDGGWAQTDAMTSDPYATATALFALHIASGLAVHHPAYRSGLNYLINSQRADGTWLVASRSKPFQPYYESGFPHGKNQFISIAASSWATTVLALSLPEKK